MYRILVVDDEHLERDGVSYLINKFSYPLEIFTANNGKNALEFLKKTKVDIVCTDIRMPFMDGLELCEHVRELYPDVFLILLTAYSDFEYAKKAIKVQVNEYLLKPVVIDEFRSIMDKAVERLDTREKERMRKQEWMDSYKSADDDSLRQLMDRIMTHMEQEIRNQSDTFIYSKHPLIKSALDIINREYANDISLEEVADRLKTSKGYLSSLFKTETTISMIQYVTLLRMNKAEHLLRNSVMHINDIAEAVGYHDASYFSVQFKKLYGKTPKEYRNNILATKDTE